MHKQCQQGISSIIVSLSRLFVSVFIPMVLQLNSKLYYIRSKQRHVPWFSMEMEINWVKFYNDFEYLLHCYTNTAHAHITTRNKKGTKIHFKIL